MECREGCSFALVLTMFGCQGEVARKRLEFPEHVRANSGAAPWNNTTRCGDDGLCQEEGPSSHARLEGGETASGAGRFTDLAGMVRRFPWNCFLNDE